MGDMTITAPAVPSLHGLEQLQEVGGALRVADLKDLQSLEGLEGLKKLDGALTLSNLPKVASLEALGALKAIGGSLSVSQLESVTTLEGLGAIGRIGGDLSIASNDALTDLDELRSLSAIDGTFTLSDNPALVSASIPSGDPAFFPSVGGDIVIFNNDSLKTATRFGVPAERAGSCDDRGLIDGIFVAENDSLETVELPVVRNANVSVANNDRLSTVSSPEPGGSACMFLLSSLPRLTKVSVAYWLMDTLSIVDTGLTTLDGFEQSGAKCRVNVSQNAALTDVGALSHGSKVASMFDISQNPALASCQVQAMLDAFPAPTGQCGKSGPAPGTRVVSIKNNDDSAACQE